MKPLSERLANLLAAVQSATMRNDVACLALAQAEAERIIAEIKELESKE